MAVKALSAMVTTLLAACRMLLWYSQRRRYLRCGRNAWVKRPPLSYVKVTSGPAVLPWDVEMLGHLHRVVERVSRDPLARQAVGHARLVAKLVVAVGRGDYRRLAGIQGRR